MELVADANGVVKGKFAIPAGVRAGAKAVVLAGSGGSYGETTFVGQGTLVSQVLQSITSVTTTYEIDPLAQTFTLPRPAQVGAVDLIVTAKGDSPIIVQIRETQVGFPTSVILAEGRLDPSAITVGSWNRFMLDSPIHIQPNVELAIVVLCNDAIGEVAVAELGKWDTTNMRWVTNQPYQIGVLLSSSNASTWTAHQDRDLTFRLLARQYTESSRDIDLGSVTVTGATDLIILPMADNPATGADSEVQLTMPDGSVVSASDGQSVRLPSPVTGEIGVKAKLRATQAASAVLYPGTQIVSGAVQSSADYISRAFDADAAGANVRVIFDANLPSGSSVTVHIRGVDSGDAWQAVAQSGVAKPIGNGVYEYQYFIEDIAEAKLQVKLVLTGTSAARPFVYNLRVSVT